MKKTQTHRDFNFVDYQDQIHPHLTLLKALTLGVFFKADELQDTELQSLATSMRESVEKLKEIQTNYHQKYLKNRGVRASSR